MAKNEKNTSKVPGAAVAIVAVIVAVTVFVPTVYMPYKNKKPQMDSEHQEAVDTINYYETSIQNQAQIEKDIEDLEKEWAEFEKKYFVDASASLDDLQTKMDEIEMKEDYNLRKDHHRRTYYSFAIAFASSSFSAFT